MNTLLNPKRSRRLPLSIGLVSLLLGTQVRGDEAPILANLSFEQLSQIQIVSVSRNPEPLWNAPAAVSVLTHEEIQRFGATSIPEALQGVPGLNVAQINANNWAIGARGFQWQYANKLLVMIDGRSVYSPSEGGVRWEDNTTFLEDVDRIEVVRGPGGSVWGANAVNGVISIVTRSAFDTVGTHVFGGGGNELLGTVGVRQGYKLSDTAAIRFYGMYRQVDDNLLPTGTPAVDGARFGQGGFRLDWKPSDRDELTLQGDFYDQRTEYQRTLATLTAPPTYSVFSDKPIQSSGANVLGRWRHSWSDETQLEWQSYWDWNDRQRPQNSLSAQTFDTDLTLSTKFGQRQEITTGLGYRYINGNLGPGLFNFEPATVHPQLFSAFLQDEIALVPDRLTLTLGSKIEHNSFTGWEPQPSARLAFTATSNLFFWGSVARAVRTPTWLEETVAADFAVYPPGVLDPLLPATIRVFGNPDLKSEKLTAYELGVRWKAGERLAFDLSTFYYNYDDYVLVSYVAVTNQTSPPAQVMAAQLQNGIRGESYGGEFVARWDAADWWRLSASYHYVEIQLHTLQSDPFQYQQDEDTTPHHAVHLQSAMQLGPHWQLNLAGRYVDRVSYYSIPDYFELDAHLAWAPNRHWQVALSGRNLLHDGHLEYDSALNRQLTEIERSVFLMVRWNY